MRNSIFKDLSLVALFVGGLGNVQAADPGTEDGKETGSPSVKLLHTNGDTEASIAPSPSSESTERQGTLMADMLRESAEIDRRLSESRHNSSAMSASGGMADAVGNVDYGIVYSGNIHNGHIYSGPEEGQLHELLRTARQATQELQQIKSALGIQSSASSAAPSSQPLDRRGLLKALQDLADSPPRLCDVR